MQQNLQTEHDITAYIKLWLQQNPNISPDTLFNLQHYIHKFYKIDIKTINTFFNKNKLYINQLICAARFQQLISHNNK